ncbi:unnamed protein product [Paramecium pentaurelia]|uniref:Transmembrane protein n=1 Tax=Paramecium pentaurelia TaxID=43138 RepID=A0A8S1XAX5_9CILI|nr:unnamed protein product [Paramecium pentaurelia]
MVCIQFNIIKITPIRILKQGKVILTNKLMIPSNQEISKYELYNPKLKKFSAYINEFSIQLKNRFNEQLLNFTNSTCQIMESIIDIKKQDRLSSSNTSLIYFNQTTNNFDLGMLIFNLDPYNQTDKQYKIEIQCKTQSLIKELLYKIKVQSLICQLGEFNVLNGCLTCQSTQGFYSVTYNATKCSIFDKIKFEAITSNNIKLKPGYWRSHQESDLANDCFKNIESYKGGWAVGDEICKIGHVGGLCEECDKHNTRGDGYYFINDQFSCLNCSNFSINILSLGLSISFYNIKQCIENQLTLCFIKTHLKFCSYPVQDEYKLRDYLIKVIAQLYLDIFCNLYFQHSIFFFIYFVKQMNDTPYFLTRNLDCEISQSFEIELIYIRVLGMFTLISLQIFVIQLTVNIFIMLTKGKFSSNISSITIIYLYISLGMDLQVCFTSLITDKVNFPHIITFIFEQIIKQT